MYPDWMQDSENLDTVRSANLISPGYLARLFDLKDGARMSDKEMVMEVLKKGEWKTVGPLLAIGHISWTPGPIVVPDRFTIVTSRPMGTDWVREGELTSPNLDHEGGKAYWTRFVFQNKRSGSREGNYYFYSCMKFLHFVDQPTSKALINRCSPANHYKLSTSRVYGYIAHCETPVTREDQLDDETKSLFIAYRVAEKLVRNAGKVR